MPPSTIRISNSPHTHLRKAVIRSAQLAFGIPNFIDTALFRPGERSEARAQWGFPPDALVVLSVAGVLGQAIKSIHEETSVSSLFV